MVKTDPTETQIMLVTYGKTAYSDPKKRLSEHTANVYSAIEQKKTINDCRDDFKKMNKPAKGISPWVYTNNMPENFTMDKIISETTALLCISGGEYQNQKKYPTLTTSLSDVIHTRDKCWRSSSNLKQVHLFIEKPNQVCGMVHDRIESSVDAHSKKGILEKLTYLKAQSQFEPNAQLLVHISAHGDVKNNKAGIVLCNGDLVTAEDFSKALTGFKGRVVFIIDTCYSGNMGAEIMSSALAGTIGQKIRKIGDGKNLVPKGPFNDATNMYCDLFVPFDHNLSKFLPLKARKPILYMAMSMPALCVFCMLLSFVLEFCDINVASRFLDMLGYGSASLSIIVMVAAGGLLAQVGSFWILSKLVYRCHAGGLVFGSLIASNMMLVQRMFFGFVGTAGSNLPSDLQGLVLFVQSVPLVVGILCCLYSEQHRVVKVNSIMSQMLSFLAKVNVERGMWLLDGNNQNVRLLFMNGTKEMAFFYNPMRNNECVFINPMMNKTLYANQSYTHVKNKYILTCNVNYAKEVVKDLALSKYETLHHWRVNNETRDFKEMVQTENSLFYNQESVGTALSGPDYLTNVVHTTINRVIYGVKRIGDLMDQEKLGTTCFFMFGFPLVMSAVFLARA